MHQGLGRNVVKVGEGVWWWNWLKWKIFDNITDITHVSDRLQLCEFEKEYHTVSVSISLPLSSAVDAPPISPYFPAFCSATLSFDVRFSMLTSGETWRLSCSDGQVTWRGWWMRLDVYGRKTTSTYWSRAAAALRFSVMFGELNRNWALLASSLDVEAIKNYNLKETGFTQTNYSKNHWNYNMKTIAGVPQETKHS